MGHIETEPALGDAGRRPYGLAELSSRSPRWLALSRRWLGLAFASLPFAMVFVPWQQNLSGSGQVVAFAPLERQQEVEAPIDGRVVKWWVQEGSRVKAGDPLVELADIDPGLVERLELERRAVEAKLAASEDKVRSYEQQLMNVAATRDLAVLAAQYRVETARERARRAREARLAREAEFRVAGVQLARLRGLLPEGIVSQREVELAERDDEVSRAMLEAADAELKGAEAELQSVEAELERAKADGQAKVDSAGAAVNQAQGELEDARASLARMDVRVSRQASQRIESPLEGTVFRLVGNRGGEIVKAGDALLVLVPDATQPAVELFIDGRDAPLVERNSPVRLQFEGWPAVQFAGWPSVAVGTFAGRVELIDSTDDGRGKFRIMVVADDQSDPWPDARYLRQGVRANGWVLLNEVSLGYEIWRQLNGFPPVVAQDEPTGVARKRIK